MTKEKLETIHELSFIYMKGKNPNIKKKLEKILSDEFDTPPRYEDVYNFKYAGEVANSIWVQWLRVWDKLLCPSL